MDRIHFREWNSEDYSEKVAVILTEEDIISETNFAGAGWELLILPKKFENPDTHTNYLKDGLLYCKMRNGRVIYI